MRGNERKKTNYRNYSGRLPVLRWYTGAQRNEQRRIRRRFRRGVSVSCGDRATKRRCRR